MHDMDLLRRNTKRVLTDAAGYALIVASVLTGWLPGPGGIPLFIAGLGLLSINNVWAERLRDYFLKHGGNLVKKLFPPVPWVQWLYDAVVIFLWITVALLAWHHAAVWQITLAVSLFFISLAIALLNRERMERFRAKKQR